MNLLRALMETSKQFTVYNQEYDICTNESLAKFVI